MRCSRVELIPVTGLPIVEGGEDIAKLILERVEIKDKDILVISSTFISKAEGRVVKLSDVKVTEKARKLAEKIGKKPEFVQVVLDESEEILIDYPFLLVKAKYGAVCVNAGVDGSNVKEGYVVLIPKNPDESAERIRKRIKELSGKDVGVIVTDTNGRCFRKGVVGVAVGCAGIEVLKSWIGEKDLYGKELEVTVECVADEIAGAANIIMGEAGDGIPAVIVRGLNLAGNGKASDIFRKEEEDIIRRCLKRSYSSVTT